MPGRREQVACSFVGTLVSCCRQTGQLVSLTRTFSWSLSGTIMRLADILQSMRFTLLNIAVRHTVARGGTMRPCCTLFLQLLCLFTTSHTVCAFQLPPTVGERSHCVHKPHAQSRAGPGERRRASDLHNTSSILIRCNARKQRRAAVLAL